MEFLHLNRILDAVGHRLRLFAGGFGQDHGKFFSAVAVSRIELTQAALDDLGQANENLVPLQMAEGVVVFLEVVDIQQQQGKRRVVADRAVDFQGQLIVEMSRIEQLGQTVGGGQGLQLLEHLDALLGQVALLQDALQPQKQFGKPHGLEQKIAGAFADGLLVGVIGAVSGDDDHVGIEILFDAVRQFQAVHARQGDVGDDDIHDFGI